MRSRDNSGPGRRLRPILEGLEGRELPSVLGASAPGGGRSAPHVAPPAIVAHPDSPNGLLGQRAPGPFVDPAFLRQVAATLYPPTAPRGTPTAAEIRRQTFTARWIGAYTVDPPRFSDRASTIRLYGTAGGSNQFLKGKFDIVLFPPADPTATPNPGDLFANQITGSAMLFGQNYLQSGAQLALDLNGTPAPGSPPGALPTRLYWAYDNNTSGGPYAAPGGVVPGSGFTQGGGVMDLRWIPDPHPATGTSGSGRVIVTFQGLIHASHIVSGVSKFIS